MFLRGSAEVSDRLGIRFSKQKYFWKVARTTARCLAKSSQRLNFGMHERLERAVVAGLEERGLNLGMSGAKRREAQQSPS